MRRTPYNREPNLKWVQQFSNTTTSEDATSGFSTILCQWHFLTDFPWLFIENYISEMLILLPVRNLHLTSFDCKQLVTTVFELYKTWTDLVPKNPFGRGAHNLQAQDSQEFQDFLGPLSGACLIVPKNLGILENLLYVGILGLMFLCEICSHS